MARVYIKLEDYQKLIKKEKKDKVLEERKMLRECFKNVRKCNDARKLAYCY